MDHFLAFFIAGASMGLAFSVMPSPLLALAINETLKYGKAEGIKIAVVPSLTDIPIIAVSLMIFSQFSNLNLVFGIISLFGSLYLAWIGFKGIKSKGIQLGMKLDKPESIKKGVITNFLNPNPYIFWLTVGTPIMIKGWNLNVFYPLAYVSGLLIFLIGIRILLAFLIERFKNILNSLGYRILSKTLSAALVLFAVRIMTQGIELLKK